MKKKRSISVDCPSPVKILSHKISYIEQNNIVQSNPIKYKFDMHGSQRRHLNFKFPYCISYIKYKDEIMDIFKR